MPKQGKADSETQEALRRMHMPISLVGSNWTLDLLPRSPAETGFVKKPYLTHQWAMSFGAEEP
jgi:hypothetical protein